MSGSTTPPVVGTSGSADLQRLAGPTTFTLAAQGVRVAATMLLTFCVSRLLGPEALGLLTLGLTLAATATIIGCAGIDQGVIYFVARAQPKRPEGFADTAVATPGGVAGAKPAGGTPGVQTSPAAIRTALSVTGVSGIAIGLLAWSLAPFAAEVVFEAPELESVLLILSASIPLAVVLAAALGALQGSFRVIQRALIEWIMFPLLTLVIGLALLLYGRGVEGVATGYVAAWAISAVVAVAIALRIEGETGPLMVRRMLVFSLPLMLSLLTGYLLFHVDVLMLGGLATVRQVGLYGVATRLALPLFLVLASISRAFAPLAARLYADGNVERLGNVYSAATEWILAINVPAGIFTAFYAESILALFGPEFVAAAWALRILCLGIVVATACGVATQVLIMTRWQRLEMIDNVALLLLNIALNAALVPRYGALGAAIATASSAGSVFALKVVQVRWLLSLQPFRPHHAKIIVLAVSAAGTAWAAIRPLGLPATPELATRAVVFSSMYGALWWRWGCSPEGRDVLRSIRGRLL